jgi:biotin operon repressor
MATENKGVMVYLPKEVEEYITSFCTEYNITRKDKEGNTLPSLGTGIVTYLKSQMLGESPDDILSKPSKSIGIGLTKDDVLDLIQQSISSRSPINGLTKDEVIDLIDRSITNSHSPQSIEDTIALALRPLQEEVKQIAEFSRNLQGEIAKVKTQKSERVKELATPSLIQLDRPEGSLTRADLAEKLGKSRQSIEQRRDKGTLEEWGYRADKIGSNWYYFSLDQSNQPTP